jgi:V/A-type H+-transporting ATPase subunit B
MSESALLTRHLIRHTHVLSIVGDILTVRARNIGLGDLAVVENWDGEESLAQTVEV